MKKNLLIFSLLVSFLVLMSSTVLTTSAEADTPPAQPALNVPAANSGSSLNWSGYQATSGVFTGVGADWTVPTASNNNVSGDATWVGIGGIKGNDLIQAGTDAVNTGEGIVYQAWYETLPASLIPVPLSVNPGDSMTTSIIQQSDGSWLVTLKNNTTGQDYQITIDYPSSLSSAEWIEEMPVVGRGFIPLDDFGNVRFSNAWAIENGQQVSLTTANAKPITMINDQRQALARPSVVGSDGASFNVARTSASTADQSVAVYQNSYPQIERTYRTRYRSSFGGFRGFVFRIYQVQSGNYR